MGIERVVLIGLIATSLVAMASAISGTATFYTPPYVPSACYGFQDQGNMIAAASSPIFANKAACGRRYRVRCTGPTNQGVPRPCRGEVIVKIVDLCPSPGCQGTLDLSREAFAIIADPNAGKVKIEYQQV